VKCKGKHLGRHATEEAAARAYNTEAERIGRTDLNVITPADDADTDDDDTDDNSPAALKLLSLAASTHKHKHAAADRGRHSSTFRLNVNASRGIRGASRGC
jgi:hypothetical protein